jgi:hypothetical protein
VTCFGNNGPSTQGAGKKASVIAITHWSNTSAQATGVQNSLRWIQSQIGSYADCDSWLTGNNDVINTLLGQGNGVTTESVGVGNFSDPLVNAVYGTTGTNLPTDGTALLTVNASGAYFNSSASVGAGVTGINGGSDQAKLFILLHELAHATEAAGFQSGDSGGIIQGQNNRLLLQKCGDFIKSVSN